MRPHNLRIVQSEHVKVNETGQDITFGLPSVSVAVQPKRDHIFLQLFWPFSVEFSPDKVWEEVVGKPLTCRGQAVWLSPSDFLQTEYFYTSDQATWNSFAASDSEIPAVDRDQTHVVIIKAGILFKLQFYNKIVKTQHHTFWYLTNIKLMLLVLTLECMHACTLSTANV